MKSYNGNTCRNITKENDPDKENFLEKSVPNDEDCFVLGGSLSLVTEGGLVIKNPTGIVMHKKRIPSHRNTFTNMACCATKSSEGEYSK